MTDPTPILDAQGIAKRFGAVVALKGADLRVARGEIVALMGANGAGKSTLIKILTGALKHDGGTIRIAGQTWHIASPAAARKAGLVPVYQEPSLIPDLSVAQNLALTATPTAAFLHWVRELGISGLSLSDPAGSLPLATLRILDLARALAAAPDLLILDEMTAALPGDLVDRVLNVVRQQADQGRSVVYISHRFAEIARICDRATVLRDGVTVGDLPIAPGIEDQVVELMLGGALRPAELARPQATQTSGTPRVSVRHLAAGAKLTDVSIDLYAGEVLGVVALEGQGQDELFDVLAGFRRATAGSVEVDGAPVAFRHPAEAIAAGLSLVPGDRAQALLSSRSVRENIALPALARPQHWGPIGMAAEAARVGTAIDRLQIDTRAQGEVRRLSGGNQQKVTIARWIAEGMRSYLLFDPTRGIDVRTKRQIYPLVRELAQGGAGVLFYTSDLTEVPLACDRVAVIFGGRLIAILPADAGEEALMRSAYGLHGVPA